MGIQTVRRRYNFLDFWSDVGGTYAALFGAFQTLSLLFSFEKLELTILKRIDPSAEIDQTLGLLKLNLFITWILNIIGCKRNHKV